MPSTDPDPQTIALPPREAAVKLARQRFAFQALRPGQLEAIDAVVSGHDVLVVMPTGSGKSAIYQITALLVPGPTVVVSPLIALQRDQVLALNESGAVSAAATNSTVRAKQRREALEGFQAGDLELLFLAPEQLANPETLQTLNATEVSLLVIDEAHCISTWGHDFRPDYLRLGALADELGHPRVLALTATAAPPVRAEIIERLHMRDPVVLVRGFNRSNIRLAVRRVAEEDTKLADLLEWVAEAAKPGIVYVATKRQAEELARALSERGVAADPYHAGMRAAERKQAQRRFDEDELEVIVATAAFGMGIDKPNVRFVAHLHIPDSVDSYYQELGRAGRDGQPANAILWYRPQDLGLRRFFAGSGKVDLDQLERVATVVQASDGPVEAGALQAATGLTATKLATALNRLADAGAVELTSGGEVTSPARAAAPGEAARQAQEAEAQRQSVEQSRLEMIRAYAETGECRREYLLTYFGEPFDGPCGNCDNCLAGLVGENGASDEPFPIRSRVRHVQWGTGQVLRYEEDKVTVLFEEAGYRTLGVGLVLDQGLLESAAPD
jgi:ATP-dependent DNA helicase RecQ